MKANEMNDIGAENLVLGIITCACNDYYNYRRAYYLYGDLRMTTQELIYPSGHRKTVRFFECIPPNPEGKLRRKAKDKDKYFRKYVSDFYSKLSNIVRWGKDAEAFFNNKGGDLEMMMEELDGSYIMKELDKLAREAARTGKRRSEEFHFLKR